MKSCPAVIWAEILSDQGVNKMRARQEILPLLSYKHTQLREAIKKKKIVMEIFRRGSDPPPLFLKVMEPVRHNSILVTKKGKN